MKLKKTTIQELGIILEKKGITLSESDLEKLAYSLVGLFDLLIKIQNREIVRR